MDSPPGRAGRRLFTRHDITEGEKWEKVGNYNTGRSASGEVSKNVAVPGTLSATPAGSAHAGHLAALPPTVGSSSRSSPAVVRSDGRGSNPTSDTGENTGLSNQASLVRGEAGFPGVTLGFPGVITLGFPGVTLGFPGVITLGFPGATLGFPRLMKGFSGASRRSIIGLSATCPAKWKDPSPPAGEGSSPSIGAHWPSPSSSAREEEGRRAPTSWRSSRSLKASTGSPAWKRSSIRRHPSK
eukprot:300139-Prorocentrum_minimum.AAC.2